MSVFFASFKAMSHNSVSESGLEFFSGISDEEQSGESYVSGESELENDSGEELYDESEPLTEDGWQFVPDPFVDTRPNPLPMFNDAYVGIATSVPQFSCPCEAFCYSLTVS